MFVVSVREPRARQRPPVRGHAHRLTVVGQRADDLALAYKTGPRGFPLSRVEVDAYRDAAEEAQLAHARKELDRVDGYAHQPRVAEAPVRAQLGQRPRIGTLSAVDRGISLDEPG